MVNNREIYCSGMVSWMENVILMGYRHSLFLVLMGSAGESTFDRWHLCIQRRPGPTGPEESSHIFTSFTTILRIKSTLGVSFICFSLCSCQTLPRKWLWTEFEDIFISKLSEFWTHHFVLKVMPARHRIYKVHFLQKYNFPGSGISCRAWKYGLSTKFGFYSVQISAVFMIWDWLSKGLTSREHTSGYMRRPCKGHEMGCL